MQDELLRLWQGAKFTVVFVTHSIPEAIRLGNRILLLSAHPGQAKAEINCAGIDAADARGTKLSRRIHEILFDRASAEGDATNV
jgi:NitT/TauT family transport system ATP-binding protein